MPSLRVDLWGYDYQGRSQQPQDNVAEPLSVARRGGRLDLVHHTHLARSAKRILVLAQVFLRERIDMCVGAALRRARHSPANLHEAVWVIGIHYRERYGRSRLQRARFHATTRSVHAKLTASVVEPHGRYLRRTVLHYGRDICEGLLGGEQIEVLIRDCRHGMLPLLCVADFY